MANRNHLSTDRSYCGDHDRWNCSICYPKRNCAQNARRLEEWNDKLSDLDDAAAEIEEWERQRLENWARAEFMSEGCGGWDDEEPDDSILRW